MTDALLNFETVKYFTNEDLEVHSYGNAIAAYQRSERALLVSLNVLNVVQALIMFAGISTGMTVCVHEVVRGNLTVGDSVLFLTLMSQVRPDPPDVHSTSTHAVPNGSPALDCVHFIPISVHTDQARFHNDRVWTVRTSLHLKRARTSHPSDPPTASPVTAPVCLVCQQLSRVPCCGSAAGRQQALRRTCRWPHRTSGPSRHPPL